MIGGAVRRGRALVVPLLALTVLAVITIRLALDARAALHRADASLQAGRPEAAVLQYLEAARSYLPFDPLHGRALDSLGRIADGAHEGGQPELERHALEAERAAVLGTRSFYTPQAWRLPVVNRRLAELYAGAEARRHPVGTQAQRAAWHLAQLTPVPGPSLAASMLALVGLACWLGALAAFIRRGVDKGLHLRPRAALTCGIVFVLGLALFLIGLRIA